MCLSIKIRSHVLILSSILKFVTINPIKENLFVSVLPIIEYPDQILRKTAKPVVNFDKSLTIYFRHSNNSSQISVFFILSYSLIII